MGVKNLIRSLFVVAALAAPNAAHASTPNPLLTQIATAYVGFDVTIECSPTPEDFTVELAARSEPSNAQAFTEPWNRVAYFRGQDCARLVRFARGGQIDNVIAGQLVEVFTHESTHLTGIYDEGQTDCIAARNVWRMLGLFHPSARRKAIAYRAAEKFHADAPAVYRTVC